MDRSLAVLLTRCKTGEDEAISTLVRRFQPWGLYLANQILSDTDLAEDAVQEAFLAVLAHLSDLREPEAFTGWFRRIVTTYALRIARNRKELPLADGMEPVSEEGLSLEHPDEADLKEKVREALKNLTPVSRETTELFYFDELSCAEIADVLQIPKGTVRRRLHDSREQLRSMLLGYIGSGTTDEKEKKPKDRRFPL